MLIMKDKSLTPERFETQRARSRNRLSWSLCGIAVVSAIFISGVSGILKIYRQPKR